MIARIAAVQAAPVYMDLERSLDKATAVLIVAMDMAIKRQVYHFSLYSLGNCLRRLATLGRSLITI